MHDWILLSVLFEWSSGRVTFTFRSDKSQIRSVIAKGVIDLHIPQIKAWGPSNSVNEVRQINSLSGAPHSFQIEMQSGDLIEIMAASFELQGVESPGQLSELPGQLTK